MPVSFHFILVFSLSSLGAFKILPENIWTIPKKGTINIHASILPNLRGAAPINWAIIYGLKKTGLTSFFINNGIDTGDIIIQEEIDINENDTYEIIYQLSLIHI